MEMVHIHADKMDQIQTHFQVNLNKRATRYHRIDVTAAVAAATSVANHKLVDSKYSIHWNRSWHINPILVVMWWWFFFFSLFPIPLCFGSVQFVTSLSSHFIHLAISTRRMQPKDILIFPSLAVSPYAAYEQSVVINVFLSIFFSFLFVTKQIIICMYLDRFECVCVCVQWTLYEFIELTEREKCE